jgi:hypothetical protein
VTEIDPALDPTLDPILDPAPRAGDGAQGVATAPTAAIDDVTEWEEPAWPTVKRQLLLLGAFLALVGVLFVVAGTALASGGGCGGG